MADGIPVALNTSLTAEDRRRRLAYHEGYHAACDAMVAATPDAIVMSMHSFTPVYEGRRREMELGVLFNRHQAPADELAGYLAVAGWRVATNAPWSGREGLMYGADRHSDAHGRAAIELEVRQDLLADAAAVERLVSDLAACLEP